MLMFATAIGGALFLTDHVTRALFDTCHRHLMKVHQLQLLYASGDPMQLRLPALPDLLEWFTLGWGCEAVWRKLSACGFHDSDAMQWLNMRQTARATQLTIVHSLRRWANDLGYGLPGEITVWSLGGGDITGAVRTKSSRRCCTHGRPY